MGPHEPGGRRIAAVRTMRKRFADVSMSEAIEALKR
jgi:hypothetical protein